MNQINHSPSITTEDHAWEIKGAAGLFTWDTLFSLRTPVSVKAGEQVKYSSFQCFLLHPVPLASHISEHIYFFLFVIIGSNFQIFDNLDNINAGYIFIILSHFVLRRGDMCQKKWHHKSLLIRSELRNIAILIP